MLSFDLAAFELLDSLRALGRRLERDGEGLRIHGGPPLNPDELDAARRHKAELLRLVDAGRARWTPGVWIDPMEQGTGAESFIASTRDLEGRQDAVSFVASMQRVGGEDLVNIVSPFVLNWEA